MRKIIFISLCAAILSCANPKPAANTPKEAMENFFNHLMKDEFEQAAYYALTPTFEHYKRAFNKVGYVRNPRTYVSDTMLNDSLAEITYTVPREESSEPLEMYIHCTKKDGHWFLEERFKFNKH